MVSLPCSQGNDLEFVLVHDNELIAILERDVAHLVTETRSSSPVPHIPSSSNTTKRITPKPQDSASGSTDLCVTIEIVIIVLIIARQAGPLQTQPTKR